MNDRKAGLAGFSIESVRDADIPSIQAIYAYHVEHGTASFEETAPTIMEMTERYQRLRDGGFPYIVARARDRILGYAYAGPYRPRSAYRFTVEDSIYVDPDYYRRGIGQALLGELIIRSTSSGKRQMLAVIGDGGNQGSIRIHEKAGFNLVGSFRSIGFKFGRWIDSVLMQRSLGAGDQLVP